MHRIIVTLSVLLAAACTDSEPTSPPVDGRWYTVAQVEQGRGLYQTHCAVCHAADGSATAARVAWVELSTGAFLVTECSAERRLDELERVGVDDPREDLIGAVSISRREFVIGRLDVNGSDVVGEEL